MVPSCWSQVLPAQLHDDYWTNIAWLMADWLCHSSPSHESGSLSSWSSHSICNTWVRHIYLILPLPQPLNSLSYERWANSADSFLLAVAYWIEWIFYFGDKNACPMCIISAMWVFVETALWVEMTQQEAANTNNWSACSINVL